MATIFGNKYTIWLSCMWQQHGNHFWYQVHNLAKLHVPTDSPTQHWWWTHYPSCKPCLSDVSILLKYHAKQDYPARDTQPWVVHTKTAQNTSSHIVEFVANKPMTSVPTTKIAQLLYQPVTSLEWLQSWSSPQHWFWDQWHHHASNSNLFQSCRVVTSTVHTFGLTSGMGNSRSSTVSGQAAAYSVISLLKASTDTSTVLQVRVKAVCLEQSKVKNVLVSQAHTCQFWCPHGRNILFSLVGLQSTYCLCICQSNLCSTSRAAYLH